MIAIFYILAVISVISALMVVTRPNAVHSALWLILTFFAVAGLFILRGAEFIAAVQVLVYVGGISVLILLAIMLTRNVQRGSQFGKLRLPAFVLAFLFLAVVGVTVIINPWLVSSTPPTAPTTAALGEKLLGEGGFILPVEIAAALLLAAIIGAIVMVREK